MKLTSIIGEVSKSLTVKYVTAHEIAKLFQISTQTITTYTRDYGMPKKDHDVYDLEACCIWYIDRLKRELNVDSQEKLNVERRKLLRAKAEKADIERMLLSGEAIKISFVHNSLVAAIGHLKDDLNKMTSIVANQSNDQQKTYHEVNKIVEETLNGLADKFQVMYEEANE